jgi:hypothetical protein
MAEPNPDFEWVLWSEFRFTGGAGWIDFRQQLTICRDFSLAARFESKQAAQRSRDQFGMDQDIIPANQPIGEWVLEACRSGGSYLYNSRIYVGYPIDADHPIYVNDPFRFRRFSTNQEATLANKDLDYIFYPICKPWDKPNETPIEIIKPSPKLFDWVEDGEQWVCHISFMEMSARVVLTDRLDWKTIVYIKNRTLLNNHGLNTKQEAMNEAEYFMKRVIKGEINPNPANEKTEWRKKLEAIR